MAFDELTELVCSFMSSDMGKVFKSELATAFFAVMLKCFFEVSAIASVVFLHNFLQYR